MTSHTEQDEQYDTQQEEQEWLLAWEALYRHQGPKRFREIQDLLRGKSQWFGGEAAPYYSVTAYKNTIPAEQQPVFPVDKTLYSQYEAAVRWNALVMVLRATKQWPELGGHLATYASSATLYQVFFDLFARGAEAPDGVDLIYYQGHASPGIYARSFIEGTLSEEQLNHFRREASGKGLSSYPHPWLMPDYWQFPVVSMGLGPLQAIYQARMMKYLDHRGIKASGDRKVWCFCGDGEMDEPESLGAITVAAREKLDNLVFVINCNLQRLDGPVRGNGKIIQELEGIFAGAGWHVIKVIWGSEWDPLLASKQGPALLGRMEEALDGDYQHYKAKGGAYTRQHFFGRHPELLELVADLSDDTIFSFKRGGHDPDKVYAAYHQAVHHQGQPVVILAKTVKGYGMGLGKGEGENITHQQKKMDREALQAFRDRFAIPVSDQAVENLSYYRPAPDSDLAQYVQDTRARLGGFIPSRQSGKKENACKIPDFSVFSSHLGAIERPISTTMAFVRLLTQLLKDKQLGPRIVPIVPDEARTFGMEGLFRPFGIYAPQGQLYQPMDGDQVMPYKESRSGQILEEGINEAGAFASWMAAATAYSTYGTPLIPFYIYYSMFGFQRIGDLAWAAGDMRARGFLLGGTAGRTTLAGEGLQHQDGHSLILSSTIPNCIAYDPAFSGELAVIIQDGLERMYGAEPEDVYYYITLYNENYPHKAIELSHKEGILKGLYCLQPAVNIPAKNSLRVQLLGSGSLLPEVLEAAELLKSDWGVFADVWSVTSYTQLRRDGLEADAHNARHGMGTSKRSQRLPYVTQALTGKPGPVVAVTDYMKALPDGIRAFVPDPAHYHVLGTDGFGMSDTREALRRHFGVNRYTIVARVLYALQRMHGKGPSWTDADKKYPGQCQTCL